MQFLHTEQKLSIALSGSYITFILSGAQDVAFFCLFGFNPLAREVGIPHLRCQTIKRQLFRSQKSDSKQYVQFQSLVKISTWEKSALFPSACTVLPYITRLTAISLF